MAASSASTDGRLQIYMQERKRLLRLAYRFLGSTSEAEDAVQDAWLRFEAADDVQEPARFLSRVVTNLCLDRLKSAQRRRETYVGQWLPEPIVDAAGSFDPQDDTALDISYGVMRALERLSPLERAALFLHDLYEVPFEEIAETLRRSPAACRQLAARARKTLQQDRSRFRPDESDVQRYLAGFEAAARTGDVEPLKQLLARDAELVSDGGGKVPAALNIVRGSEKIARFLVGVSQKFYRDDPQEFLPAWVNDAPGLVVHQGGKLVQAMSFAMNRDGSFAAIYIVRNPDKLARIGTVASAKAHG